MYKMVVINVMTNQQWSSESQIVSDNELDEMKTIIKDNMKNLNYLEIGNIILPGDFVRNNCIISFVELG